MTHPHSQPGNASELLPCPFCGSEHVRNSPIRDGATIACRICYAAGPAKFSPGAYPKAVEAWNTRAAHSQCGVQITDAMIEAGARNIAKSRGHKNCDDSIANSAGRRLPVWKFYEEDSRAVLDAALSPVTAGREDQLGRLRQAIIDNTTGDGFWIGEILLNVLEKETGFNGASVVPSADRGRE